MALSQYDKALVDFDQTLLLNPADDVARAARGLTLLLKGNNAEGMVDIKNALDRSPNSLIAEMGQGLAMLVSGQNDRALLALNRIVGKDTFYESLARVLRARALLAKNDPAGALVDVNVALGKLPNQPDALQLRSLVWSAMHSYDNALEDINKVIAQRETVEAYLTRAKVYESQNKFDKATDDYRRATQLPPNTIFDLLAQVAAKQKTQQLSKKVPCGNSSHAPEGTCL